ncbi:KH domain-containing protein [Amycolatopsis sp. lyj-109]|uniref:KH domain-containing protein n=1 Tax=Amycolatopsis sp. lyj-109 TaxID=2789287 RepID=UPI0039797772
MSQDVELVLDLRELRNSPTDQEGFARLWADLEPALTGRDLRRRPVHELDGADGTVRLEVVRLPSGTTVAGPDTTFAVVAVRERPKIRYRCRHCTGKSEYAPFVCKSCPSDDNDNRVCDRHVVILDGALVATCRDHRPSCHGCGEPAEFRCAGRACRRERAWCRTHRRPHPRDADLDFCPSCYEDAFPRCESPSCTDLGSVRCEYFTRDLRRCPRRMCTRHAQRWQVFGGERVGLGRCAAHRTVKAVPPADLLFQIVTGAGRRRRKERLPSLSGFGYTLRNCEHGKLARDYPAIDRILQALEREAGRDPATATAITEARPGWDRQLAEAEEDRREGERLVEELRGIVSPKLARVIRLGEYKRASQRRENSRKAMLFVEVPPHLKGLFIGPKGSNIRSYRERLKVDVQFEGGDR